MDILTRNKNKASLMVLNKIGTEYVSSSSARAYERTINESITSLVRFLATLHSTCLMILSDIGELRPREQVVEVVFHLVVLGQTHQIRVLRVDQILHCRTPDIHSSLLLLRKHFIFRKYLAIRNFLVEN